MLEQLREQHPRFIYWRYESEYVGGNLYLRWQFETAPNITFTPRVVIENLPEDAWEGCPQEIRDNLVFHLGLAEMPSYWKAACSPEIIVAAGPLSREQIAWWHDLFINGMGEFFYVNKIDFTAPDFLTIRAEEPKEPKSGWLGVPQGLANQRVLVPIGGGKDSVVTLETLRQQLGSVDCMLLNPTPAAEKIAQMGGESTVVVRRTIDPRLLELNSQGYLNGHTPFSSYLAFLNVFCAILFGYRRVAVSNERSSNEGNALFHGHEINHQYSKTFDFEQKFRSYVAKYISDGVDFFSFLRPLYELQIAQRFATMEAYFPIFRSCNRGQKTNSWCESCPKCLFAYAILYPFLSQEQLDMIFSQDLFARSDLLPLAYELLGVGEKKPLECVGTHEENLAAFHLSRRKIEARGEPLPALLATVASEVLDKQSNLDQRAEAVLKAWNEQNALPAGWDAWLCPSA